LQRSKRFADAKGERENKIVRVLGNF
jgi:hypothetical protein